MVEEKILKKYNAKIFKNQFGNGTGLRNQRSVHEDRLWWFRKDRCQWVEEDVSAKWYWS